MTGLEKYHLPRIDEIPDLELYMDQVIIYVKKYFNIFPYGDEENFITPSMINNYVKSGIIPAPNGKKYSKRHIAYIFVVFFLKQIFSLEEVKAFISQQVSICGEKESYENFCTALESELKRSGSSKVSGQVSDALYYATVSIVNKIHAQILIKSLES